MLLIITAQPITCTIAHGYSKAEMTVHDMYTMGWCRVNHTTIHRPMTYFHRSLQFSSINKTTDNFCIHFIFCICRLHILWINNSVYSTSLNLRVLEPAVLKQFCGWNIHVCVHNFIISFIATCTGAPGYHCLLILWDCQLVTRSPSLVLTTICCSAVYTVLSANYSQLPIYIS